MVRLTVEEEWPSTGLGGRRAVCAIRGNVPHFACERLKELAETLAVGLVGFDQVFVRGTNQLQSSAFLARSWEEALKNQIGKSKGLLFDVQQGSDTEQLQL